MKAPAHWDGTWESLNEWEKFIAETSFKLGVKLALDDVAKRQGLLVLSQEDEERLLSLIREKARKK